MEGRWAEEYVQGKFERRQAEIDAGGKGYNNQGGASLVVSTRSLIL
jgi:hypothetical protein